MAITYMTHVIRHMEWDDEHRAAFFRKWMALIVANDHDSQITGNDPCHDVYEYLKRKVRHVVNHKKGIGEHGWHFKLAQEKDIAPSVVWSSGCSPDEQHKPFTKAQEGEQWWPCIIVDVPWYPDGGAPFYCPALAWSGSRPWPGTHESRLLQLQRRDVASISISRSISSSTCGSSTCGGSTCGSSSRDSLLHVVAGACAAPRSTTIALPDRPMGTPIALPDRNCDKCGSSTCGGSTCGSSSSSSRDSVLHVVAGACAAPRSTTIALPDRPMDTPIALPDRNCDKEDFSFELLDRYGSRRRESVLHLVPGTIAALMRTSISLPGRMISSNENFSLNAMD